MGFKLLGLRDELVRATESLGFESPMPVQEKAMPALLSGENDFVGLAQTGTGKTGAFGLPLLQLIDTDKFHTQGIVICPTRELCLQITEDLKKFARYIRKIKIVAIYGGASISTQIKRLKGRPQIIVATPGRLIDMINRRAADLSQVSYTVLDEADEMLNMGFKEDIDNILRKMPDHKKTWLFSATMPPGVAAIARNYLTDPVEVRIGSKGQSPKNIRHICHTIQQKNKYLELKQIIDSSPDILALVFCRTRIDTQALAESLMRDGYQSEALHGAMSQAQRDSVMRKFRRGSVRILVATDVAARGLDVDNITHVIHYNLSDGVDIYTHRSGRTGRVGKSGISIALVTSKEISRIHMLGKRLNIRFEFNKAPAGKAVGEKRYADGMNATTKPRSKTRPESKNVGEFRSKARPESKNVRGPMAKTRPESKNVGEFRAKTRPESKNVGEFRAKTRPESKNVGEFRSKTRPESKNVGEFRSKTRPESKNVGEFRAKTRPESKNVGELRSKAKTEAKNLGEFRAKDKPVKRKKRLESGKTRRFFINVGRLDKINKGAIVRLICDKSGIESDMIREISLNREFSFFEVEKQAAKRVHNSLNYAKLGGRTVQVHDAA